MFPQELPTRQLTSKLNLPCVATLNNFLVADGMFKLRIVHQTSIRTQYLWYSVVRKHGNLINIVKLPIVSAIKASPQIGDQDLGSFQKSHVLTILETKLIAKARKVSRKKID
jgi:hypothetical protein